MDLLGSFLPWISPRPISFPIPAFYRPDCGEVRVGRRTKATQRDETTMDRRSSRLRTEEDLSFARPNPASIASARFVFPLRRDDLVRGNRYRSSGAILLKIERQLLCATRRIDVVSDRFLRLESGRSRLVRTREGCWRSTDPERMSPGRRGSFGWLFLVGSDLLVNSRRTKFHPEKEGIEAIQRLPLEA